MMPRQCNQWLDSMSHCIEQKEKQQNHSLLLTVYLFQLVDLTLCSAQSSRDRVVSVVAPSGPQQQSAIAPYGEMFLYNSPESTTVRRCVLPRKSSGEPKRKRRAAADQQRFQPLCRSNAPPQTPPPQTPPPLPHWHCLNVPSLADRKCDIFFFFLLEVYRIVI